MNVLKFTDAMYTYNSSATWMINYDFLGGKIYQLIGGNGSGKSTIGKIATGILSCKKGDSRFNGRIVSEMSNEEKRDFFFYIPQEPHWSFIGESFCKNLRYFSKNDESCSDNTYLDKSNSFQDSLRSISNQSVFGLSLEDVFLLAILESSIWERTTLFIDECPDLYDDNANSFLEDTMKKRERLGLITIVAGHIPLEFWNIESVIIEMNRFRI